MALLQVGVAKSGNFWLYKILQSVAIHGGIEQRSFIKNHPIHERAKAWELSYAGQADIDVLDIERENCFCRIGSVFREPIGDMGSYIRQCSHVWTHSEFCNRSALVLPRFDKVIYIVRDPRDVSVSEAKFAFTPYMKKYYPHDEKNAKEYLAHRLEGIMRHWVRHVGGYLHHKDKLNIHFVFYERLLHSFDSELSNLLDFLGLELGSDAINDIKAEVDFSTMKRENPRHVRKGLSGEWARVLTDRQKRQSLRIAGSMLELLNYSVNEGTPLSFPRIPMRMRHGQLEGAMSHEREIRLLGVFRRLYLRCCAKTKRG